VTQRGEDVIEHSTQVRRPLAGVQPGNDGNEERLAPSTPVIRALETAGCADSRYRARWRSLKLTRPPRGQSSTGATGSTFKRP